MNRRSFFGFLGASLADTLYAQSAQRMPDMSDIQSPKRRAGPPPPPPVQPPEPPQRIYINERPVVEVETLSPPESDMRVPVLIQPSREQLADRAENRFSRYARELSNRGLPATAEDMYIASDVILGEAGGESQYHQSLIADVIRNRYAFDSYELFKGRNRQFGVNNRLGGLFHGSQFSRAHRSHAKVLETTAPDLAFNALMEYVDAVNGQRNLYRTDETNGAVYFNNPLLISGWTAKSAYYQIRNMFGKQDVATTEFPHIFYKFQNDDRQWQKTPVLRKF